MHFDRRTKALLTAAAILTLAAALIVLMI